MNLNKFKWGFYYEKNYIRNIIPNGKSKSIIHLDSGNTTVAENTRVALVENKKKNTYESDVIFLQNRTSAVKV